MKKNLLLVFALSIGAASVAQHFQKDNPRLIRAIPVGVVDMPVIDPIQTSNPTVHSRSLLENDLGQTRYDLQTNHSIQERIFLFQDGTMAGVWTKGQTETSFTDRGTGYNYFNGSSWGAEPTGRIESVKTGWPSVAPWNGNGEVIVSHQGVKPLVMNTRPVKGTGNWTESLIPLPAGCAGIMWPRMITNGPDHNNIHIIATSAPTGNGGNIYLGMNPALLYYRSLDGGASWDKTGIQIPGMDSLNYSFFLAETYAWGSPKGDTIYFAVGGCFTDTFIMKSTDNGETWIKIPVLGNANKKIPHGTIYLPPWRSTDGAVACEMDQTGIIHFASGIGSGQVLDTAYNFIFNVNGLVYWNTTMPMLQDSLFPDTLDAHGQLLGYYSNGPDPGDTLVIVPGSRVGLTSRPQISVDDFNNLFVIYSGITWQNPNPEGLNYRHIFGRARFHDQTTWSTNPIDFNAGTNSNGQEFNFACMAKQISNDKLRILYQTSDQPGMASWSSAIPFHDNIIQYREIPVNTFWPAGAESNSMMKRNLISQNFPNPFRGSTNFNVNLSGTACVAVEVSDMMGQTIMRLNKGTLQCGTHQVTLDCSRLAAGIYFYTVKINGEISVHKMIVE